jgi:hypothetical protein
VGRKTVFATGSAFRRTTAMYRNTAILAAMVLVYSAIARRVARSWLSGPILFVTAGIAITTRRSWTSEHWLHIPVVPLAALCFTTAQALGEAALLPVSSAASCSDT